MADIRPLLTEAQRNRWRKRMSESHAKYVRNTPGERKRLSNIAKLLWATPKFREGWHKSRPRKARVMSGKYYKVCLPEHPRSDKRGYILEHRLLMERKLGRHLLLTEVVHHINGDGHDNRIENLIVMSSMAHRQHHNRETQPWKHAVASLRRFHPLAKLTRHQVREVRHLYKSGKYSQLYLAHKFHVCQMTISKVVRRETFRST